MRILFIDSCYICLGGASTSTTLCTCQHHQQQQLQVKDIIGYLCFRQHKHTMHACRSTRSSAVMTWTVAKVFNILTLFMLAKLIIISCYVYVSFRDKIKRVRTA